MKRAFFVMVLLAGATLAAQVKAPATPQKRQQVYLGAGVVVTRKLTSDGVKFEPTSAANYELSYRYCVLKHFAVQGDYDLFLNSQKYQTSGGLKSIATDVHAGTANAVIPFGNPLSKRFESSITFGGGALTFVPRNASGLSSQTVGEFSIGGGDDLLLSHNLRIRLQVKGIMYKAPDFGVKSLHTDKLVQTVMPTLGVVYSF